MNKKKVLHYIPGFKIGGIESLFLDLVTEIDNSKYEIFLLVEKEIPEDIINVLNKNKVKIYRNDVSIRKHPINYLSKMYNLLKKLEIDILHLHIFLSRIYMIFLAKILNIPKIIVHAHTTSLDLVSKIGRKFYYLFNKKNIIEVACAKEAGKCLFGERSNFNIITNGVNFEKFKFNNGIKEEYIKKLNLENKKIVGMIGRISYQKNQRFAIEIFEKLNNFDRNYVLLLIGNEADDKEIPKLVKDKGLEEKVIFLGARNDIKELLSLVDIYLMPSRYEGLSVGLLEAQASGVQCLISNTITSKNIVTENVTVLSLNDTPKIWAEKIIELCDKGRENINYSDLSESEYSIKTFTKQIEKVYDK